MINNFEIFSVILITILSFIPFFFFLKKDKITVYDDEYYYLANRKLNTVQAAFSIAGSWVWAPALFVCSQIAYNEGISGAFWFIIPNVLGFYVLIPIALRIRRNFRNGYTLAEFFYKKFKSKKILVIFVTLTLSFQFIAIIENNVALISLTNITINYPKLIWTIAILIPSILAMRLIMLHGLRGSVISDTFQMGFMIVACVFIIYLLISRLPQDFNIISGIGGINNKATNPFKLNTVLIPGLALLLGLIGGPMIDMMFFQRIMSLNSEKEVKTALSLAGLIFATIPITLSIPGFVAAGLDYQTIDCNNEIIGLLTIAKYADRFALPLFILVIVTGLLTTLDSSYAAILLISGKDIFEKFIGADQYKENQKLILFYSRIVMILMAVLGLIIAFSGVNLFPVFLLDTAIATSGIIPVIYVCFSKKVNSYYEVLIPLLFSFCFAIIFGVIGIYTNNIIISGLSSPFAFLIGIFSLLICRRLTRK